MTNQPEESAAKHTPDCGRIPDDCFVPNCDCPCHAMTNHPKFTESHDSAALRRGEGNSMKVAYIAGAYRSKLAKSLGMEVVYEK